MSNNDEDKDKDEDRHLATIFSWSFTEEPSFSMWNDGVQFKVFTKAAYEIASLDEKKEMLSIIWCYLKKFEVYKKYCHTTGLKMLNIFKTDYKDIISSILSIYNEGVLIEQTRDKWNEHKEDITSDATRGGVNDLLETRFNALKSKLFERKGNTLQTYVFIDGKSDTHYEFEGLTLTYMNSENDMYTQTTEDKKGGGVFGKGLYDRWKKHKAEKTEKAEKEEKKKKKAEMFLTMKNLLKIAFYPKSSGVYDIKFLFSGSSLTENNKFQVSKVEPSSVNDEMTTTTGLGLVYIKEIELDVNKKTNELRKNMIETLQKNNSSKLVDVGDDILNRTHQPSNSKITSVQDNTISVNKFPRDRNSSIELEVGKYYRTELDKELESESIVNAGEGEKLPAGGSKNKRKTKKRKNKNKRKTKKRKKSKIKGKKKRRKTKRGKKKKTGKSNQKNRR